MTEPPLLPEVRLLRLRYGSVCAACDTALPPKTQAWWDAKAKNATCRDCHESPTPDAGDPVAGGAAGAAGVEEGDVVAAPEPLQRGTAGASALLEYQRRSSSESRRKARVVADDAAWREEAIAKRPVLGRVASALTPRPIIAPESQSTRAWAIGAVGEQALARSLDSCEGVIVLHDRRIPGTRANIDHIAVAPSGIYVIDAKNYTGEVRREDRGGLLRVDHHLIVGRRDCTKLVEAMARQVAVVDRHAGQVPVMPVLCFTGAEWKLFARPFDIRGVVVTWPKALTKRLTADGPHGPNIEAIAQRLASALPPAE